jgi:predicted ATP-dependent protease
VIIPEGNRKSLMLKPEVVEAVRHGTFHIWAVTSVDQGIEILTGVPAGERQDDGTWPEDSVNCRVDRRLREMAEIASKFNNNAGGEVDREIAGDNGDEA